MAQLWGGRFTKETDKMVYEFNASITFDQRLYEQDIQGSIAHASMLAKQGILTKEEKRAITDGLEQILEDVKTGRLEISEKFEDIHSFVEATLTERIGEPGKKLHTGRSRNDQVAFAAASADPFWHYGGKSGHLYAGLHPSAESAAYYTGSSRGSLF